MINTISRSPRAFASGAAALILGLGLLATGQVIPPQPVPPPAEAPLDQLFVNEAGHMNNLEMRMGELALEKSSQSAVRLYAQDMITTHRRFNQELATLARELQVQVPLDLDLSGKGVADALAKLDPREFDARYLSATISNHQAATAAFENRSKERVQTPLSLWAAKSLLTLRNDQARAEKISGTLPPNRPEPQTP